MPFDADGIAAADFHLARPCALWPGHAINPGHDVGDAVGMVGRQLAEDKGKWPADEAEGDRFLNQQGAVALGHHGHVEAVGRVSFVVLGGDVEQQQQSGQEQQG